jgi:hypothetical protein
MSTGKARLSLTVRPVESILSELAPDPATFTEHLGLVQAFVRAQPGAHAALMEAAHEDPEKVTMSIVALGAVLLDIAAGAFKMSPDDMLDKVALGVAAIVAEDPLQPAP